MCELIVTFGHVHCRHFGRETLQFGAHISSTQIIGLVIARFFKTYTDLSHIFGLVLVNSTRETLFEDI